MRAARRSTFEQFWVLSPLADLCARQEDTFSGCAAVTHAVRRRVTSLGFPAPTQATPLKWLRPRTLWQRGRLVGHCVQWEGCGQPHQATLAPAALDVVKPTRMDWLHLRAQCGASHAQVHSSLPPWARPLCVRVPQAHRSDPMPWLVSWLHPQLQARWHPVPSFDFEIAAVQAPQRLPETLSNSVWTKEAVTAWWHFVSDWVARLDAVESLPGFAHFGPPRFDKPGEGAQVEANQVQTLRTLGAGLPVIHHDFARLAKVVKQLPYLMDVNKHLLLTQGSADAVWDALEGSFTWFDESMRRRPVSSMLSMLSRPKQALVLEECLQEMWANRAHAHLGQGLIVALDACPDWPGWTQALLQCRTFHCSQPPVLARLAHELAQRAQECLHTRLPASLDAPLRPRL